MSPQLLFSLIAVVYVLIAIARAQVGPSGMTVESLLFQLQLKNFIHDPGTTNACLASPDGGTTPYYFDMKGVQKVVIEVAPTIVGGAGITLVEVFASTDVLGATNATKIKTSGVLALDSVDGVGNAGGDVYRVEIHAQEIAHLAAQVGASLRYLTVAITTSTNTDEASVRFIAVPMFAFENQSATVQN